MPRRAVRHGRSSLGSCAAARPAASSHRRMARGSACDDLLLQSSCLSSSWSQSARLGEGGGGGGPGVYDDEIMPRLLGDAGGNEPSSRVLVVEIFLRCLFPTTSSPLVASANAMVATADSSCFVAEDDGIAVPDGIVVVGSSRLHSARMHACTESECILNMHVMACMHVHHIRTVFA
ncbi:unnamed protein product [Urochloa humidicola]